MRGADSPTTQAALILGLQGYGGEVNALSALGYIGSEPEPRAHKGPLSCSTGEVSTWHPSVCHGRVW